MRLGLSLSVLMIFAISPVAHAAEGWGKACNVAALCAGVQPGGGRLVACLKSHYNELTDACFLAFGRTALGHNAGQAQTGAAPAETGPAPGTVLQSDGTYAPAAPEAK